MVGGVRERRLGMRAMGARRRRRQPNANPLWAQTAIWLVLLGCGLVTLVPMLNVLAKSLSESYAVAKNPLMLVPQALTLDAYRYIFTTPTLMRSFAIGVFATVVGTFFNLVFTTSAAYALSKTYLPGYRVLMWIVIIPMLVSAGLIPTYLLVRDLHLIDNIGVLVFVGLVSPFNLVLMRNFFWSLPPELEESATLDGASPLRILWHVVLPLSRPVIATVGLFYAAAHWNDFFTGLIYLNDSSNWPLQVVLRSIVISENMMNMGSTSTAGSDLAQLQVSPENIKAATIIFALVPILIVYPFIQRYFVKGILLGAVKS
jgi:putative aldouronate transport system permease protein